MQEYKNHWDQAVRETNGEECVLGMSVPDRLPTEQHELLQRRWPPVAPVVSLMRV